MVAFCILVLSLRFNNSVLEGISRLGLAPLSCEAETNCNKAETDNHVPCANSRNWIGSLANVENYDPEQADKKVSDHYWSKP